MTCLSSYNKQCFFPSLQETHESRNGNYVRDTDTTNEKTNRRTQKIRTPLALNSATCQEDPQPVLNGNNCCENNAQGGKQNMEGTTAAQKRMPKRTAERRRGKETTTINTRGEYLNNDENNANANDKTKRKTTPPTNPSPNKINSKRERHTQKVNDIAHGLRERWGCDAAKERCV